MEQIICGCCGAYTNHKNPQVELCHSCFTKNQKPPVIDAEKLVQKLIDAGFINEEKITIAKWCDEANRYMFPVDIKPIAQLITSNLDLSIELCEECKKKLYERD